AIDVIGDRAVVARPYLSCRELMGRGMIHPCGVCLDDTAGRPPPLRTNVDDVAYPKRQRGSRHAANQDAQNDPDHPPGRRLSARTSARRGWWWWGWWWRLLVGEDLIDCGRRVDEAPTVRVVGGAFALLVRGHLHAAYDLGCRQVRMGGTHQGHLSGDEC